MLATNFRVYMRAGGLDDAPSGKATFFATVYIGPGLLLKLSDGQVVEGEDGKHQVVFPRTSRGPGWYVFGQAAGEFVRWVMELYGRAQQVPGWQDGDWVRVA